MVENGKGYMKSTTPKENGIISNGSAVLRAESSKNISGDISLDVSDVGYSYPSPGQKCFGEKSDVERVLDSRCPCFQYKCLHLSGTFLVIFVFGTILVISFRHYLKDFLQWLEHINGWVSGLTFVLMFTIVSFPMTWGYIVLNVASGYLYGFLMGLLTVTISVIVGVATSLIVCRIFIRDFVHSKLQSEHLKAIIRVVESRRGFKVIVLTRLTPIPFGLQNGLFAITSMSIPRCLLASFIGLLPTQALNAYMGSTLRTMEDVVHHNSAGGYLLLVIQVGISGFLMWYVIRRARYELNKACLPTEYDSSCKQDVAGQQALHLLHSKINSDDMFDQKSQLSNFDVIISNPDHTKKQGHKRAQSASAVLYAFEKSKDGL